jgi:hypothetical protein
MGLSFYKCDCKKSENNYMTQNCFKKKKKPIAVAYLLILAKENGLNHG